MKLRFWNREVKVGILTIVAIFLLYFGLNFLKGVDVFKPISYYYAIYDDIGGLVPSSPVYIKGYKTGQVEEVNYDFSKLKPFVVKISVEKNIKLPKGTQIQLFDDGLMGGKAIQIVFDPLKASQTFHASGDTLLSNVSGGLLASLAGNLMPKIENVARQSDSLLLSVRSLLESENLKNSLASIETATNELAQSSVKLKLLLNNDFPRILSDINILTTDFKILSGNLKKIDFAATFDKVDYTIKNLNQITDKINSSDGSIGLLLNDKSLYLNLANTAQSADNLIIDLKANPKRYVNFSVFGSKNK